MQFHPVYLRIKIAINIFAINQTGRSTFSSLANFALSPIVCYSFANCFCSYDPYKVSFAPSTILFQGLPPKTF